MSKPLVSAIITTCKRSPEMLAKSIRSILSQTYTELEIIVVDDSPSDYELREAIEKMMIGSYPQIKYIQHEKNSGACAARNTGIDVSSGKYIAFLDDDDEWLPEKIEKQVSRIENCDDIALVYCGQKVCVHQTGQVWTMPLEFYEGKIYHELILRNFIGSTSKPLLRRTALLDVGAFDPGQRSAQDYDVWLRLSEKYLVSCVNEPLIIYNSHAGDQISKDPVRIIAGLEALNAKNWEYIKNNREAYWNRTIKLAPYYANVGNGRKAIITWLRAVKRCPFKIRQNIRYALKILLKRCD